MRKRLASFLGLDTAVVYSLSSKGFSALAQPAILYFIASVLSPVEQGYYYTFYSVLALTIFLELGLGVVITHFASHEFAALRWTDSRALTGNEVALGRLLSIVSKSMNWYGVIVGFSIAGLIPLGLTLFRSQAGHSEVNFVGPWIFMILAAGIGTWLIPIIAVLGGSGRIADVQRIKLVQNIVGSTIFCLALAFGARLYAPALMLLSQSIVFMVWFVLVFPGLVVQLMNHRRSAVVAKFSWATEIFPMQWRVALSWLSSYFIGYTANPLLFAFRGPVEAGQMGMSRSIADLVAGVGMPWVSTRSVTYGMYVNRRDYASLDRIALRSTLQGLVASTGAAASVIVGILVARRAFPDLVERILPLSGIAGLLVSSVGGVAVNSMGEYLRAHKREPYLHVNLVLAVMVTITNVVSAMYFNATTMAITFALVTTLLGWPLAAHVFVTQRRERMRSDGASVSE